jgi:hypothetical protein
MWYRPDGGSVGPGPLLVGNIRAARSSVCTQRGVRRLVGIPAGLGLPFPKELTGCQWSETQVQALRSPHGHLQSKSAFVSAATSGSKKC